MSDVEVVAFCFGQSTTVMSASLLGQMAPPFVFFD